MTWGKCMVKLGLSLAIVCVTLLTWTPTFADPGCWSDDLRLTWTERSASTGSNSARKVACDAFGNIHVVWSEIDYQDPFNYIYYICKPAGGADWTEPVSILSGIEMHLPALACDPWGNVHVVAAYGVGGGGEEMSILYRKYDGTSWGPTQSLGDDTYDSWNPAIAADGLGKLHVVWTDNRDGNEEIYYKQFDGAWGPDVRLTNAAQISRYPAIAVDSQNVVHVVWVDNRYSGWVLCYKNLSQSGWSPDTVLEQHYCNHPAIAVGPDDALHVVRDGSAPEIPSDEIFYKERNASGWTPEVQLSFSGGISRYPTVEADADGNVHVAWFDCDGNDEIYYCLREGTTWCPAEQLTNDPGLSQFPSFAADGQGNIHLLWCDTRDTVPDAELYYKQRYSPSAGLLLPDTPVAALCQVKVLPNPARSEVNLGFRLASAGPVSIVVTDVSGRVVWHGSCASPSEGWNSQTWTCRDTSGHRVAPGIYLARIQAAAGASVAKIVVTK